MAEKSREGNYFPRLFDYSAIKCFWQQLKCLRFNFQSIISPNIPKQESRGRWRLATDLLPKVGFFRSKKSSNRSAYFRAMHRRPTNRVWKCHFFQIKTDNPRALPKCKRHFSRSGCLKSATEIRFSAHFEVFLSHLISKSTCQNRPAAAVFDFRPFFRNSANSKKWPARGRKKSIF